MTARVRAKAPSAKSLTVIKRDGRVETFDAEKIVSAVRRCFTNGVKLSPEAAQIQGEEVRDRVLNIIDHDGHSELGVEDVQRLIIQQLWATGQFDAAEHYQNYRERRRKARSMERQARPEEAALIAADVSHFGSDLRYYQFLSKYARWNEEANRRETWREACSRVMRFMRNQPQLEGIAEDIWAELDRGLYDHEATCSMRVLQMAGPALERCNVGAYNCAALDIDCLEAFAELLYTLMQGSGVGFSVEGECVDQLPRVKKQKKPVVIRPFVIPDSTEGWCDALLCGLRAWFAGTDVDYDYTLIRPAGAKLKTKGGRASGPEPLRQLLAFAREKVLARQGGRLSDLDCHDICCMIGKIVQVGGVRRAAEISISDLDSEEMRFAKHGDWWVKAPMRDMANNSAAYDEKPDPLTFLEEWIALGRSGSGERGIFNRFAINKCIPNRRKRVRFIINPCGEIILRSCQFCNLTICVARVDDTVESLRRKVRLAAIWGTLQATLTKFGYLRDKWRQNCEEERLLGIDITGQQDCPLLRYGAPGRAGLLRELRQLVIDTNAQFADRLGIPRSAATTCVKPSGNSGQFFQCSSGVHTRYAQHQIRRFRAGLPHLDPLTKFVQDQGVVCNIDPLNPSIMVLDFLPEPAPAGTPCRNDLTALQQLEYWLETKENWAEHSVSCTIYIEPHEWLAVGNWVYDHFDRVNSIAFMPKDGGTYRLMPNQEVTAKEYTELKASFPKIDWSKLSRYENDDYTSAASEPACTANGCEV